MAKQPDLSLVLACYNEAPIIEASVARIVHILSLSRLSYEIIFVDDKSRDRTPILIKKLLARRKNWKAIFHKRNSGRGRTVADGILKARGRVVGFIDIDLEVSPVYLPVITDLILHQQADVVIGKRIYRTSFASITREIWSSGYRLLAGRMLGTGNLDTETGYKFFNRKKILPVLKYPKNPGWFWDTEIMYYAKKQGLRIREVPVLFIRRYDKKSSVRIWQDIPEYLKNLWEFWRKKL